MNNMNFLRLVNKTRMFYGNYDKCSGLLQQLAKWSVSANASSQKMKEKEGFHNAFPGILDTLMTSPKISQLPEVGPWIKKILEHNLRGGKQARGLMTMLAYEMLEKPENITEEYLKLSKVLGWCLEITHAYFCMLDDIMDGSTSRRGSPCWYRMPNVGMGAINDSILIYSCVTEIVESYFRNTPHFADILLLFNESVMFTTMGQHIDFTMAHRTKHDYSLFTVERYDTIVKYKTAFYTFRLPVLLGLTLVKDVDKNMFQGVNDICLLLGNLYQIQDDYIDCYGDEAWTGKAGTDIQEGKCSWLAATALQHCNEAQRETFVKYYASKDPEHIARIKKLYEELSVPELYTQKETDLRNEIVLRARELPSETAPKFFYKLIERIYKRDH